MQSVLSGLTKKGSHNSKFRKKGSKEGLIKNIRSHITPESHKWFRRHRKNREMDRSSDEVEDGAV